jgi:hypothetical protein
MSADAQALYFQLNFESECGGYIVGVKRFARASGLAASALDELFENGFLIQVEDETYITHYWVNNKYDQKVQHQFMENDNAVLEGYLDYEGEEARSAYIVTDAYRRKFGDNRQKTVVMSIDDYSDLAF